MASLTFAQMLSRPVRSCRWLTVLASIATVAAIAIAVLVLASGPHHRSPAGPTTTHPQPSATGDPLPPAAGQREWRYDGLAINVPASWPANATFCGFPQRDTVLINGGPQGACTADIPTGTAWVELGTIRSTASSTYPFFQIPHAAQQHITVDGLPALRSEGVSISGPSTNRYVVIIAVPSLHVAISAIAPHAAQANRLAATLHRVPPTTRSSRGTVDGTLTYSAGHGKRPAPAAGTISVYRNPSEQNAAPVATTRTDGAGQFSLTLPPGSYFLKATVIGHPHPALGCSNSGSTTVTDRGFSTTNVECRS